MSETWAAFFIGLIIGWFLLMALATIAGYAPSQLRPSHWCTSVYQESPGMWADTTLRYECGHYFQGPLPPAPTPAQEPAE